MPGYFSFQKLITPPFVKFIYVIGLLALTAGGIALAVWAGLGLRSATLPTRMGVYYIAIGAGAALIGNLLWRVLCEIWIVLFNIHNLLGFIGRESSQEVIRQEWPVEEQRVEFRDDVTPVVTRPAREVPVAHHPSSVLGLS